MLELLHYQVNGENKGSQMGHKKKLIIKIFENIFYFFFVIMNDQTNVFLITTQENRKRKRSKNCESRILKEKEE